ncbi:hypothetical protein EMCRGX_G004329 [Ephydatia muelleri]|eukprot:Em0007g325a
MSARFVPLAVQISSTVNVQLYCKVVYATPAALIQARSYAQNYGSFTRDPFKSFQRKLARKQATRNTKVPLVSTERSQTELLLPVNIWSLGQTIVTAPLEKFAKPSLFSKEGLKYKWSAFKDSISVIYSGAVIRRRLKKIEPFQPIPFARWAQQAFCDVNEALMRKDKEKLVLLTTEGATNSLKEEFENKRFVWKMVEDVERPRVVSAKIAPLMDKDNLYAQVVVRMHTKQVLAVYDTAGRLLRGDEKRPKDVIDYVVFERNLSRPHPSWRIATKLPPQLPWRSA